MRDSRATIRCKSGGKGAPNGAARLEHLRLAFTRLSVANQSVWRCPRPASRLASIRPPARRSFAPTAAAPAVTALSSSNRNKRHYNARTSSADFLEAFPLSIIQAKEARQEEREERKEDRKMMMAAITAAVSGLATVFGGNPSNPERKNKRKVRRFTTHHQQHVGDSSSSDSSVSSALPEPALKSRRRL